VLDASVKPVWNASIDRFSALFGLACGILVAVIITDSRAEEGIAKEQYRRMSSLDQLTGLYNRAAIVQQMSKAFDVPTDKPQRVFVLIDLDNFKKVNDQLGHQMGDFVLSRTGMVLRSCFADKDFIGRSGGDEFMILVDRPLSRDDLVVLLDTVEARVIGILTEQEEHVSCSIGAVIWDGVSSYPEMFRYADESLYEAKRRGTELRRHRRSGILPAGGTSADVAVRGEATYRKRAYAPSFVELTGAYHVHDSLFLRPFAVYSG
jgi:energy-coupling factor transport system substrate-specific component